MNRPLTLIVPMALLPGACSGGDGGRPGELQSRQPGASSLPCVVASPDSSSETAGPITTGAGLMWHAWLHVKTDTHPAK